MTEVAVRLSDAVTEGVRDIVPSSAGQFIAVRASTQPEQSMRRKPKCLPLNSVMLGHPRHDMMDRLIPR